MILILSSDPGPGYGPNAENPLPDCEHQKEVSVTSLKAASIICRDYIERNQLDNHRWSGGQVYNGNNMVAEVSYNGTVWTRDGFEIDL
jgi:hypothetical protein